MSVLNRGMVACVALATAAVGSQAATINVSGVVSQSSGSVGPIGLNQTMTQTVHAASGTDEVVGTLQIANRIVSGQQQMSVNFSDLRIATFGTNTSRTFTIAIDQDFVVSSEAIGNVASANQTFQATSNMITTGQQWSSSAKAFHEGVEIPRLNFASPVSTTANDWGGGWRTVDLGTTNAQQITINGVYRIRTVYTFTLTSNPACDWMAIEFNPDSQYHNGEDRLGTTAHLALVPLPPAAWAGLGGLALAGFVSRLRQARLQAAAEQA